MPCSGLRSAYGWHRARSWRQLSLPVPRSPSTQTAPSVEQARGWKAKPLRPLTPGQELFVHSSSAFPPPAPQPPLSFLWPSWQALPLAYTATTSWARERCHITPAKKHRHSSTFSRERQRNGAGPSFSRPKHRMILRQNETKTERCLQKKKKCSQGNLLLLAHWG